MKTKSLHPTHRLTTIAVATVALCLSACGSKNPKDIDMSDGNRYVQLQTTAGDIVIRLYNETPQHRDNFVKLVTEGTYEGTLFHRVIKNFMVQAGDPDSKKAVKGQQLGSGDVGYTVPAEFHAPELFHKRGALAAARTGDEVNPEKASSGCQFYIVTGQVYNDSTLAQLEANVMWKQKAAIFGRMVQENQEEINRLSAANDREGLMKLQDRLTIATESEVAALPIFTYSTEQREAYTTVGGTPFLDGEYTVFGEVVSGMDVVEAIEGATTDANDRPESDIVIRHTKVLQ